jgi:mRNA interferase YafQ
LTIVYTSQFKKDYKRIQKQGKDTNKLRKVIEILASGEPLEPKYRDHPLFGKFKDYRDCHIEPDWILIYKLTAHTLLLERTGTHSELFK